ncbi:epsin-3 isoform X3 [Chiroxiphia lanceolata]|uniref:Epsin-3 isoform X3 n=1 Tax=Lepidothrix coronata TaxID=321398 RepID=A0A6J0GZZ8_9PASS|nr:PREDICTED: epsin-3 isoform X3 [Lepidothrix coronata]XP_032562526.1 epsin-3 isoform X3 [Chiroxiphia lanceolata]XP_051653948.1 epsin-3 isoform X3 [Manacus candei]
MTTSALRRQVKNIVHNYSEAEIKVREATSNDPWGPPSSLMSEIADLTFNTVAFAEVMGMIWRRLNDSGKNWRHVYKALTLLDYLIKTGSEKVTHQCRENLYTIQTLKDFQYVDRDGKDQGINIREKVKQVMALLKDEERLKQERAHALQTKERMALEGMGSGSHQVTYGRRASPYGEDYGRARGSPSSFNSSSSSPRFASDLEQARPQTTGEEELQLQLALAMSREEAEKKPLPISSTDEERQLQLALALSKEEHEKEVRTWQGENSLQQRAVEETAQGREEEQEEDKMKKSQSSILELADIFGPAPAPSSHASADPWDVPDMKAKAEPVASAWAGAADPWVPVPDTSGEPLSQASASAQQTSAGPWDFPPSTTAASDPWGKAPVSSGFPPADPWGTASPPAPQGSGSTPAPDPWAAVPEQPPNAEPDPFGDLFPSTRQDGAKSFDLTNLADSLPESGKERKDCKTPEAFLGPAASSLVNLDSLVAPTPASKTRNPFLSGLSTPSPTNPFSLSEQPKPTLNQMRTSSPVPGLPAGHPANSMTYSASLPMPLSSVPSATAALPASASAFPQAGTFPELPGALPQPLLPLSGPPAPPSAPGGLNPFL